MAERRMFSKRIIDSDAFLDMPASTQALYFHLSMRADDDGFIDNPRKIQKMVGASPDDLNILVAKSFLIQFDTGVVVITHWRMHNYIQNDRYKPTIYTDEKAMLYIKDNKAYTLEEDCIQTVSKMDTNCIQTVSKVDTQDRLELGKVSIELDQDRLESDKDSITYQLIADMYNNTCVSFPKVTSLSDARKKAIRARMRKYKTEDFDRLFRMAEESDFLKGANDRNWSATFDWLISDRNMAKVLDGNYNNRDRPGEEDARMKQLLKALEEVG